jgi:hypothetical protein
MEKKMSYFQQYYQLVVEGIGGDFSDTKTKKLMRKIISEIKSGIKEREDAGIELEDLSGRVSYGIEISSDEYQAMKTNPTLRNEIFTEIKRQISIPNATIKLTDDGEDFYVDIRYKRKR